MAEFHISKHRNGDAGVAMLGFERASMAFHSLRSSHRGIEEFEEVGPGP